MHAAMAGAAFWLVTQTFAAKHVVVRISPAYYHRLVAEHACHRQVHLGDDYFCVVIEMK